MSRRWRGTDRSRRLLDPRLPVRRVFGAVPPVVRQQVVRARHRRTPRRAGGSLLVGHRTADQIGRRRNSGHRPSGVSGVRLGRSSSTIPADQVRQRLPQQRRRCARSPGSGQSGWRSGATTVNPGTPAPGSGRGCAPAPAPRPPWCRVPPPPARRVIRPASGVGRVAQQPAHRPRSPRDPSGPAAPASVGLSTPRRSAASSGSIVF